MTDIPEITDDQFEQAIPARLRARLVRGQISSGRDIVALRHFIGMSQTEFAQAMESAFIHYVTWNKAVELQMVQPLRY